MEAAAEVTEAVANKEAGVAAKTNGMVPAAVDMVLELVSKKLQWAIRMSRFFSVCF